jgi:hypothetical protein
MSAAKTCGIAITYGFAITSDIAIIYGFAITCGFEYSS